MRTTLAVLLLMGCEATDPNASGERAWVMLDESAAREGWRVAHADWVDAPRLPTEIDPSAPAVLEGPRGESIDLALGEGLLAEVTSGGAIERLEPGVDVPIDRLIAHGDADAAGDLAELLEAALLERDGALVIEGDGLFERTGFVEVPDGLDVSLDRRASAPTAALGGYAIAGEHAERAAALVGAYQAGGNIVIIDAEGGFSWTEGCWGGGRAGRVIVEDQRIVLLADDGRATALVVDEAGRLSGDGITFTVLEEP